MQQERRSGHRTRLPDASVVYESAHHEPRDAELLDLGTGGLFIPAVTPLPRGTRLALEIRLSRGGPSWPALGRVVWTRASGGAGRPSGMGVKIVDLDEAARAAIERAIGPAAPARERTVRGIGIATPPAAWVAKGRSPERTERTKRGRVVAAALVVAAAAAAVLGMMQSKGQRAQASLPPAPTSMEVAPAAVSVSEPAPSVVASVATTATQPPASTAVAPRTPTGRGARTGSRPPAWRAWTPTPKRTVTSPSDNPY
jgi:Tfp pilus assembly protein PilZ